MVRPGYIFPLLVLLKNVLFVCGDHYDPQDCTPQREFEIPGTSSRSYEFQVYTKENPLTLHIIFQNLNEYLNSDRIILSNESTVYHSREGRLNSNSLNVSLSMDGWQTFSLSINGSYLHINSFTKILDYPVKMLTVIGRYLTICNEGTPMWYINDRQETIIPILNSNAPETLLKLFSVKEFEPYLETKDQITPHKKKNVKRSNNDEIVMSKNQDYILILSENKMIIKNKDGVIIVSNLLLKRPSELLVSSRKGEFNITLLLNHPFQETEKEMPDQETQPRYLKEAKARYSDDQSNSTSPGFIVMAIITAMSVIFCVVAIIIILRSKNCSEAGHGHDGTVKEFSNQEVESADANLKKYNHVAYKPII